MYIRPPHSQYSTPPSATHRRSEDRMPAVGAQSAGVQFGVSAADVDGVGPLRQGRVGQRTEEDRIKTGTDKNIEIVLVVKGEGGVAGDRQAQPSAPA